MSIPAISIRKDLSVMAATSTASASNANPKATPKAKVAGYETTFITRAEMTDEQLKALQDKVKDVITSFQGEVVAFEDWGTKKLAYKIEKESRGRFSHFVFTALGNAVAEIERNLRLNDFVMRFLSVNVAKEFNADEYAARKELIKLQAKKREEEREARREERNAERRRMDPGSDRDGERDFGGSEGGEPSTPSAGIVPMNKAPAAAAAPSTEGSGE